MRLRTITLHQPWASALAAGVKDVENRPQRTTIRGAFLIHAGTQLWEDDVEFVHRHAPGLIVDPDALPYGAIIGVANLVDVVFDSRSPWAFPGKAHWEVEDAALLTPVRASGRQGWWYHDVPRPKQLPQSILLLEEIRAAGFDPASFEEKAVRA